MKNKNNTVLIIVICVLVALASVEVCYILFNKQNKENIIVENNTEEVNENRTIDNTSELPKDDFLELKSEFIENGSLVYDYDLKTEVRNIDLLNKSRELVIEESSKLKKKSNINLFNYLGKVNMVGENYYYVNYEVHFYNLPKDVYEKNKEQIKIDHESKLTNCNFAACPLEITEGYKDLSKYLVKKAFYYYIFDEGNKVETRSILSKSFVTENIPNEWLKLGNYKTKDAMFKDVLLMQSESHTYNNYLVIYDTGLELKFKYKGKSKTILNENNYNQIDKLYVYN